MLSLFNRLLLLPALLAAFITPLQAIEPKVENFALIDHEGKFHEFDYYRRNPKVKGIVLFIQGNGCPLVRKRIPELKRLSFKYQSKGILFGMLNANIQDERGDIAKEAEEFGINLPILKDSNQLVANMLRVNRTAEALLIDTKGRKIVFRGPIDDSMSYQSEKPGITKSYLRDAIDSFLSGKEITEPKIDAPGCKITLDMPEKEISYAHEVAPILKKRCVECHTKGGVGPFAMSNYKKVQGWSEMMAEMVLTKQMPPWHADPHHGEFSNTSSITDEEAQTLVRWIRAGSPRGEGDDPLANYQPKLPDWKIDTPDEVIPLPLQHIPAEGILEYRYAYIDSPFDRDVWIGGAEINPGNLKVLHHAIAVIEDQSEQKKRNIRGHWITGYAPGTDPEHYPKNTGVLLKKNQRIKVQLHYTVSGRSTEDTTVIGLHLLDVPPAKVFRTDAISHHRWIIPAHDPEYAQSFVRRIPANITLYSINPHMHFRGKRMRFTLRKPDGNRQVLLSVPNYNFNWQRSYFLAEPLDIPAGSQILIENAWDNSPANLFNPNPEKPVKWGDQTDDEMFFATFTYVLNK
ncbi:redoxin domain-containing protein [Akkermansiaceae bacterium]|nr:redoxin domain-containing protein [Akkermansiaceae bacterium]